MKNILENDKKDEKANRYIKTNFIYREKKNDNEKYKDFQYIHTYNTTKDMQNQYIEKN